ncbi:hypothetical protein [Paenibacillus tengchongensis]|uniref:hypothetical protein n=1 Tax=Paenibacillus tengchongensis TaxID=2608684 RepID=UPI00124DB361|nr:hypothetical protein [Paenibacillus tengchongensis]
MTKKVRLIILPFFIVLLILLTIYSQLKLQQKPTEYTLDLKTNDFVIKNLSLVKFNNYFYLSDGYYVETIGSAKIFDGVKLKGDIDGNEFLNISISGNPFVDGNHKTPLFNSDGLYKMKLKEKSVLEVEIDYAVNGQEKTFSHQYELSEHIKPLERIVADDL